MKKVLIGLLVIVILIGGGIFYVASNLDDLVKTAIETAGTDAMGAEVKVDSVSLDLASGQASIYGFSLANPTGFSDSKMMSFDELSVAIDLNSLSGENIVINSIVARNPFVSFESLENGSNFDVMSERFASEGDETPVSDESAPGQALAINSILIEDIQASLQSHLLSSPIEVNLGNIELSNLSGTPEEIAKQVMGPLISQLTSTAGSALLNSLTDIDLGELEDSAKEAVDEKLNELQESATSAIDEALGEGVGDELKKGLGNLLGN